MKKALLVVNGLFGLLLALFGICISAIYGFSAFSGACVLVGGSISFYLAEYLNKLGNEQTKATFFI